MNTLYIQLPCKTFADRSPHWLDIACQYALVSDKSVIDREAIASLTSLSATIAKAQRVIVMLAASDVTLLQVAIPPLPAAKLKAALPNLVEEQLLGNPADCTVIAGDLSDGLRTVAVVQRAWLEQVRKALTELGARHTRILPAQLCLPYQAGRVFASITPQNGDMNLTLRLSEQTGLGLTLLTHQAEEIIQNLHAVVPSAPITLHVPAENITEFQETINKTGLAQRITLASNTWPAWIAGVSSTALNLLSRSNSVSALKIDWQPWRWPLRLASAVFIFNIIALNFDWWQMSNEARNLRASMTQIYQSRYPKETVVIDPIAQMQQKIAFAKRDAGLATLDDFTTLAAIFGETWSSISTAEKPVITTLEYRDHSLLVSHTGSSSATETLMQQMKAVLASRNLSLTTDPVQSGAVIWRIRSTQ